MSKFYKQRAYLDPIHGPIQLNLNDRTDNLLSRIIDTKEFQRLRRIKQMGLGWFTFHGAEHSRFGHSLGSLFIARKMLMHLSGLFPEIKKYKTELLVAALIHDIGHGPFSHTFEKLSNLTHEDWTEAIILGSSETNLLLKIFDSLLPGKIIKIFKYRTKNYLSQIVSSYIDCDRLDYLYRDSYYVGVPYGYTGLERIISSLEIDKKTNNILVKESIGLDAIIHYLQARHSMYQQVYQHKKNLACDFMLKKIIQRAKEIKPTDLPEAFTCWFKVNNAKNISKFLDSYLQIDDQLLISTIEKWAHEQGTDNTLHKLSESFVNRKLFKSLIFREGTNSKEIKNVLAKAILIAKKHKLDPNYYVGIEQSASKPYEPYKTGKNKNKAIFIKQNNNQIKELSRVSSMIVGLSNEVTTKICLVFAPKLESEIRKINDFKEIFK